MSHTNAAILEEKEPLQDRCGIIGAYAIEEIRFLRRGIRGLEALQTRGYDGAGFVARNLEGNVIEYKGEGTVKEVFNQDIIHKYDGKASLWVFHVRYGTSGDRLVGNASVQPIQFRHIQSGEFGVVAHNGQFKNRAHDNGAQVSDTVLFAKRLATSRGRNWSERIANTLHHEQGAWSLIIGTSDGMFLVRDPRGIRPLVYGHYWNELTASNVWLASSETDALSRMGVHQFTEVLPGEMVHITSHGPVKKRALAPLNRLCIFENVYIMAGNSLSHTPRARPNAINKALKVGLIRRRSGEILAQEAPLTKNDVDMIVGIPGTGIAGGRGYAKALGLPYAQAITDHTPQDDQRTFMAADIDSILEKVLRHFNFDEKALRGKRVGLVDDSLVRGNIITGISRLLKKHCGVKAIHVRIVAPPIDNPCALGVNTRSKEELIAARIRKRLGDVDTNTLVEAIRKELELDSLAFLSTQGLKAAQTDNFNDDRFCTDCMMSTLSPLLNSAHAANGRKNKHDQMEMIFHENIISAS